MQEAQNFLRYLHIPYQSVAMSAEDFATKEYDYVICGGGTAGLVIAARLTEDPNITVGVLEAGGNGLNDMLIDAPNLFLQLFGKPQYDWDFKTVGQVGTTTLGEHSSANDLPRREPLVESMGGPGERSSEVVLL
jgi:choline dehydrogenase-like flavoprotein